MADYSDWFGYAPQREKMGPARDYYTILTGGITLHKEGFFAPIIERVWPTTPVEDAPRAANGTHFMRIKMRGALEQIDKAKARGLVPGVTVCMEKDWRLYGSATPADRKGTIMKYRLPMEHMDSFAALRVIQIMWHGSGHGEPIVNTQHPRDVVNFLEVVNANAEVDQS